MLYDDCISFPGDVGHGKRTPLEGNDLYCKNNSHNKTVSGAQKDSFALFV